MSRIYFHAEHDEAEVLGSERHQMRYYCDELFTVGISLHDRPGGHDPIRRLLPAGHLCLPFEGESFEKYFRLSIRASLMGDHFLLPDGTKVDPFESALNTALVAGSDPIKLGARLHGQCEIHTYVEGPDRRWLAGIIQQGLDHGIFRADAGWDQVVALLRKDHDSPVVTSYSVCDQFPNRHVAGWVPKHEHLDPDKAWYGLPEGERWGEAVKGLRRINAEEFPLVLSPETWETFRFGNGTTGIDLRRIANDLAKESNVV
ncbi:MAG: hypothetical protein C4534_02030 [Gaiellales bacterium]|nr:MAG: hypothetical protein C4534_02030 [Gaiellales bacterium]